MKLGIIGGSGLYKIEALENIEEISVCTPYGMPSDNCITGTIEGEDVVFLPRHARTHSLLPQDLNHKANIYALKSLGVTHILSVSAVGSLQEKYAPRDVVFIEQYVDRTKQSINHTFFGEGIVGHIPFAEPTCPELTKLAFDMTTEAKKQLGVKTTIHKGATYLNMEGPAFSTKAESNLYRQWGMDVIGMTNLAEAKLAREAEICYVTMAMVTDYDCWHPDHDSVTVELIIGNLNANVTLAKTMIRNLAKNISTLKRDSCPCPHALEFAIITHRDAISDNLKHKLEPIMGKYL